jgi:hypothetical protein
MKIPFVEHKNKPAEQHKVSTHSVLRFFTAKKKLKINFTVAIVDRARRAFHSSEQSAGNLLDWKSCACVASL